MPSCLPFGRLKQWEKCSFFERFFKSFNPISLLFPIYLLWESSRSYLSHWWPSLRYSNPLNGKNARYTSGNSIRIPNNSQSHDSFLIVLTNRNLDTDTLKISISDIGESSIVVSEILFEHDKNIDFVEVHNQGINALFLEDLDLLVYDNKKILNERIPLKNEGRKVIFPNETLVLTSNESDLFYHYSHINRNLVIQVPRFPNLRSTGGEIEIVHHLYGRIEKVSF